MAFALFSIMAWVQSLAAQTTHAQAHVTAGTGRLGGDGIAYVGAGAELIGSSGFGVGGELGRLSGVTPYRNRPADFALCSGKIEIVCSCWPPFYSLSLC